MTMTFELGEDDAAIPAPDGLTRLYAEAFATYGGVALFNRVRATSPTLGDVAAILSTLRIEGDLSARGLAERMGAEVGASVRARGNVSHAPH